MLGEETYRFSSAAAITVISGIETARLDYRLPAAAAASIPSRRDRNRRSH